MKNRKIKLLFSYRAVFIWFLCHLLHGQNPAQVYWNKKEQNKNKNMYTWIMRLG